MQKPSFMKKGKEKFKCQQDETGAVYCETFREFEDGATEKLAEVSFQFDAQCKPVPSSIVEYEEGALNKLHKKAMPILKQKCINRAQDY